MGWMIRFLNDGSFSEERSKATEDGRVGNGIRDEIGDS